MPPPVSRTSTTTSEAGGPPSPACAAEPEGAALRHGVERVGDDLEQRLLQLHRVDPDLGQVGGTAPARSSTRCSRSGSAKAGSRPSTSRGTLSGNGLKRRRPAEAQQVADPAVEPVHLLDDRVERARAAGGRVGVTPHQLGRGPQARQRIPESVGHRGRHLADRRELLRLHQLRLGTLQLATFRRRLPVIRPNAPRQVADLVARGRL